MCSKCVSRQEARALHLQTSFVPKSFQKDVRVLSQYEDSWGDLVICIRNTILQENDCSILYSFLKVAWQLIYKAYTNADIILRTLEVDFICWLNFQENSKLVIRFQAPPQPLCYLFVWALNVNCAIFFLMHEFWSLFAGNLTFSFEATKSGRLRIRLFGVGTRQSLQRMFGYWGSYQTFLSKASV